MTLPKAFSVVTMIVRNLIFDNGTAYDITATQGWVSRLYERSDDMDEALFISIMRDLEDCRYKLEMPEHIQHCDTGVFMERAIWLYHFGIQDIRFHGLDRIGDESIGTFDGEECIEDDEMDAAWNLVDLSNMPYIGEEKENEIIDLTHLNAEMNDETDTDDEYMRRFGMTKEQLDEQFMFMHE